MHFIIAIDASLGSKKHIGYITLGIGSLCPGLGVKKELPRVGDIFITGIINVSGTFEHFLLQTTRLSMVVDMADSIARGYFKRHRYSLQLSPAFQRSQQRYLIDIFQIASHRHAAGNSGHFDSGRFDQFADIHCRRLALQAGIRRDNDLVHIPLQPLHQFLSDG